MFLAATHFHKEHKWQMLWMQARTHTHTNTYTRILLLYFEYTVQNKYTQIEQMNELLRYDSNSSN